MDNNSHLTVPSVQAPNAHSHVVTTTTTSRPRATSQLSPGTYSSQSSRPSDNLADSRRPSSGHPSIRIRRIPSASTIVRTPTTTTTTSTGPATTTTTTTFNPHPARPPNNGEYSSSGTVDGGDGGRRRSSSEPLRRDFAPGTSMSWDERPGQNVRPPSAHMPEILEAPTSQGEQGAPHLDAIAPVLENADGYVGDNSASDSRPLRRARTNIGSNPPSGQLQGEGEYENNMVDFLDVIDPEVSTLSTLTNVQNSLFIPNVGQWLNRRPTYTLSQRPTDLEQASSDDSGDMTPVDDAQSERPEVQRIPTTATINTISSNVNDKYFAVLPHGVALKGWSEEDKLELNDHVRHMLHSRRSKFKRSMKGFRQYIKKPLGFFVTLYATLITLFGLAWVLFLIGWINVGGRQLYIINVIDNVLVALFAVVGDGLAPFRAVDTYHMCFIAHYHHLTWRLRREQSLPKLENQNDLPGFQADEARDGEKHEISVLNGKQQARLLHHQGKFSKSHSFYRPHETDTHKAFPLRLLVAVVVLLDCHSLLQIALGTCTWAISYHVRPFALTTVILCFSITCNITAGVLISVGDRKTRKKDVVERMFRQELTSEAMKQLQKKRRKDLKRDLAAKGFTEEERKQIADEHKLIVQTSSRDEEGKAIKDDLEKGGLVASETT